MRYYISTNDSKRRQEKEWLNEVNILIKTKDDEEILTIYDYFRYDSDIYTVTELCMFDL